LSLAPLLFRTGVFVGRFLAGRLFRRRFLVARFLKAARLFPAGFFAPLIMAPILFTLAGRRLDTAKRAAKRLDFTLVVKLLAFRQLNQFLDFFHLIERLFQGLNDTAYVVRRFGDSRVGIAALRFLSRRTVG
jgi:hypothetical protein